MVRTSSGHKESASTEHYCWPFCVERTFTWVKALSTDVHENLILMCTKTLCVIQMYIYVFEKKKQKQLHTKNMNAHIYIRCGIEFVCKCLRVTFFVHVYACMYVCVSVWTVPHTCMMCVCVVCTIYIYDVYLCGLTIYMYVCLCGLYHLHV